MNIMSKKSHELRSYECSTSYDKITTIFVPCYRSIDTTRFEENYKYTYQLKIQKKKPSPMLYKHFFFFIFMFFFFLRTFVETVYYYDKLNIQQILLRTCSKLRLLPLVPSTSYHLARPLVFDKVTLYTNTHRHSIDSWHHGREQ